MDEGYHFRDVRSRHDDLYAEYNQAQKQQKGLEEAEAKIRKVWGRGPYVVRREG
ncbi:hypothetical protein GF373_00320 [bacterium]|nr:hypothetical protein [bacterium]